MSTQFIRRAAASLPLAAIALAVSSAYAAPVVGSADDATFYTYPDFNTDAPAGAHGDLKTYRKATVKLGAGAPDVNAWNIIYQSKDSLDADFWQSGTVIVPKAAWSGSGARPVISYAVGTHGLATKCAPGRKLADGKDYEIANINAALNLGYAVLVTDYEGALSGDASTYLAGKSQGQAALDIVRAASQIPGAGVSATASVGIWGFSQGGQTAAWAGELASTYTPNLKLVGVAAGGVPANFKTTAPALNGNIGFAFFGAAINGLSYQYPGQIPLDLIANDAGKAALAKISTQCVFEALFEFQNKNISQYTKAGESLENLLAIDSVSKTLDAQNLGTKKINVPLYLFHGTADEFIPFQQGMNLRKDYCAKGTNVTFDVYPSEHIVTQFQGAAPSLAFLKDRFEGKAATGNCSSTAVPKANPNPGGGDFIVSLDNWDVSGNVGLKTLGQTVPLPAGSKIKANANVTAKTLTGALTFPAYKTPIKVIGLNLSIGLLIESAGNLSGSNTVDNEGVLRIDGNAPVNITVTNVLGLSWGTCKTVSPVNFPVKFEGPVSALGNGGLQFSGSTSFPQIKGCFISGILSGLMSGPGQTYTLKVTPPAPVKL